MKSRAPMSNKPRRALLSGRTAHLPGKGSPCPVCGKDLGGSQEVVKLLGGGAVLEADGETYGPANNLLGFLDLFWNWSPPKGEGYLLASLPIANRVRGGQFSITVCSLNCLARLFSGWVKELKAAVREERDSVRRPKKTGRD